jgi:NitT/TauT family transport system substrate-binding protein
MVSKIGVLRLHLWWVLLAIMLWIQSITGEIVAEEAKSIRIGYFPNVTHAQAVYARATKDMEKALGVPIEWTSFNAGPSAIESLFADAIDVSYIGPGPTINGFTKSKGEKFVIIAGAASGGAGLIVRNDSNIQTDKDFTNKTIATPQLGNTQDIAARNWFARKGYTLKEKGGNLALIPISNSDQFTLFQKKEIDGAWTIEPWLSRLEIEGGGKLFLDEKTLWPEGKYVTTHLIVSRAFLDKNPGLVKKLITSHIEITQKINSDKKAAATILNEELKKETGKALPEKVVQQAMERVEFTWDPIGSSLKSGANAAFEVGIVKTKPDLTGIYSLKILNDVLKEKLQKPVSE